MWFEMVPKQSATMKSTKSVAICTSGLEEHYLTIVLLFYAMADATFTTHDYIQEKNGWSITQFIST